MPSGALVGDAAGHRVTDAAQHLHGGIGLDVDYPVHRYVLWSKQIELSLGSATRQLLKLGAALAATQGEVRCFTCPRAQMASL